MIENYQDLPPKLYAGDIDECFEFLDARRAADSNSADYWHWRAVTYLRAQQFDKALDICFYLTRESDVFGYQIHCLADACSHLGLKETALTAIDYFGKKPTTPAIGAFLWRVYGWHYLGEDQRVLDLSADGVDEHSVYVLGHHQARSQMRLQGIEHGVAAMHRWWSSPEARRALFPHVNLDGYWSGQRELPARITVKSIASGYGDLIQWVRYLGALEVMGVKVEYEDSRFRLVIPESEHEALAAAMRAAGFTRASTEGDMWTDPFALFTSLFPALGHMPFGRYIEPAEPDAADAILDTIWHRARGRRCVGIFWSSSESPDNFGHRSLCLPDLDALFDHSGDIYWVIMQRGFERKRWLEDPRSRNLNRFTTLDSNTTFAQSIALLDRLDAFAGNDGSLAHIAGALGKRNYLLLNQVAEWRYESDPAVTKWYPATRLVRANELGGWRGLADNLGRLLNADAR
jgi:hypothetical protein